MFLSDRRIECNSCHEQMPPGTRTTWDEEGREVHADGCNPDFWAELMAEPAGQPKVQGRYRGPQLRKQAVCPRCYLVQPCDCD